MSRYVPNYYYDEGEGDYSESDAVSDAPPMTRPHPDVTEIYRRKMMQPVYDQGGYCKGFYTRPPPPMSDYYYEGGPAFYPPAAPCCRMVRNHVMEEPRRYYVQMQHPAASRGPPPEPSQRVSPPVPPPPHEEYGRPVAYSQPQISGCISGRRGSPHRIPSSSVDVGAVAAPPPLPPPIRKRAPVTVRTPRYYRRSGMSSLYKKPSALCLPVVCKADAPSHRRNSKKLLAQGYRIVPEEGPEDREEGTPLERRDSLPDIKNTKCQNSKCTGDCPAPNLDAVLTRCEKYISEELQNDHALKMHVLKAPKTPSSFRNRNDRQQQTEKFGGDSSKMTGKVDRLEVEEITTEIVDSMLNELFNVGEEDGGRVQQEQGDGAEAKPSISSGNKSETQPKSFNYADINETMRKSSENIHNNKQKPAAVSSSEQMQAKESAIGDLKLYRSKTYIVDFIDRAVSKELGTVPDEKFNVNYTHLLTQAGPIGNSMLGKNESQVAQCDSPTTLPLEAAEIFAESHHFKPPTTIPPDVKQTDAAEPPKDEPMYIKQLKQLRWRHFRHIVREIKRLEDLERYLDQYNSGPIH